MEVHAGTIWMVETVAGEVPALVLEVEESGLIRLQDLIHGDRFATSSGWLRGELAETEIGGERFLHPVGAKLFRVEDGKVVRF